VRFLAVAVVIALLTAFNGPSAAQSSDAQVADKIVTQLLAVKPGQVVLISADPTHLGLAEDISVSVSAIGAYPVIVEGSNRLNRLYWERVPARYDSLPPKAVLKLYAMADATVSIDFPADPTVLQGVPPSRIATLTANNAIITAYVFKHSIPGISIGNGILPSAGTAAQYGVSLPALSAVFNSGLNADYAQIRRDAATVASAVSASHRIHITAPNGTDLTLAVTKTAEINDGAISPADRVRGGAAVQRQLPAGDVYFLPVPTSATGTLVFGDFRFNGTVVTGLAAHFAGGKVTALTARRGLSVLSALYTAGGAAARRLGFIDVGTNRSMHLGPGMWGPGPSMAAGYVTAGIGANYGLGGSDDSAFSAESNVPNATVTLDGKALVSHGTLR